MQIYNLEIKDSVHDFIWEIWEYIFRHSFNFNSSEKIINLIYKEIFSLKIFPYRCHDFNEIYKVLTINKRYRVFYRVLEEQKTVIISRIFASWENYPEYLE
jgi:plasmid stabilization system protein ParE